MVPAILGMRNARRFNYAAPVLLVLAALSWPFNGDVALYFVSGSLFLLMYIMGP